MKSEMKVTGLRAEFIDAKNIRLTANIEADGEQFQAAQVKEHYLNCYTPDGIESFNKFITAAHAEGETLFQVLERNNHYAFTIGFPSISSELEKIMRVTGVWPKGMFSAPRVEPPFAPWADVAAAYEISYNDGLSSRSRHSKLLIYSRSKIMEFDGKAITGVAAIKSSSYHKNGKWSNTSYDLVIAPGYKHSAITQSWEGGRYVDDVSSLKAIKQQLGLDQTIGNAVVEEYLKSSYFTCWKRYQKWLAQVEEMERLEEQTGSEFIQYAYTRKRITKRAGDNMLLVDGEVFDGEPSDKIKIKHKTHYSGHGGGSTEYDLLILSSAQTEEIQEYDGWGDDSLESRGYRYEDGKWLAPQSETESPEASDTSTPLEDTPWAALKDLDLS